VTGGDPLQGPAEDRRFWLAVLLVVLGGVVLRFLWLSADAPIDMHWAILYDEGYWAHNARNRFFHGVWTRDDHNAPLILTPAWTLSLYGVYRLFGTGLAQTRLLSAIAGVLAPLVLFLGLRTRWPRREAFLPAAILLLGYFPICYSRAGLTESFQLFFIVSGFTLLLAAERRPALAPVAGVSFTLALLSKPSAGTVVIVWAAGWLILRLRPRTEGEVPPDWRIPARFLAGALALFGIVLLVWALPHRDLLANQLRMTLTKLEENAPSPLAAAARVSPFGWAAFGFERNGFFLQTAVPLLAVLGLGLRRLLAVPRRRLDPIEVYAWCWLLLGLLSMAPLFRQPDRRFLFLAPAVAILAGRLLAEGGLTLGWNPGTSRLRRATAGALLGGVPAFLLHPPITDLLMRQLHLSNNIAASLVVTGAALLVALFAVILAPRLPALRLPGLVFVFCFLLAEPLRFGWFLRHPTFTMRDASRALGQLTADWTPDQQVIGGLLGASLSLENRLFPLIRLEVATDGPPMNAGPDVPYRIGLQATSGEPGGASVRQALEDQGFRPCLTAVLRPAPTGRASFRVAIMAREDLTANCPR